MKHTQKEIAEAFSNGDFELTFPYLSENIIWDIVGENLLIAGRLRNISILLRPTLTQKI